MTKDSDSVRVNDFLRDGFVVIREFLPPVEFAGLQQEIERYIRVVVPALPKTEAFYHDPSRPETLKQLQRMEVDPYFQSMQNDPRWDSVAQTLLGERAHATGCEWFNKPPGTDHVTPPHQDNFYFNLDPPQVVTLWLALDGSDEANGCLRYVRGSHLGGRRAHCRSDVLGFSQAIEDYCAQDQAGEVPMRLQPNDLVAHHGWTIHRADANRSRKRQRRSFAMVFCGISCQLDRDGLRHYQKSLRSQHEALLRS